MEKSMSFGSFISVICGRIMFDCIVTTLKKIAILTWARLLLIWKMRW